MESNSNYKKITFKLQLVFDNLIIKKYITNIAELEKVSFPNPWGPEEIEYELKNLYSFNSILLINNDFGGYIFSHILFDEANINKFCILERIRRKGIGSYLLENFLNELKKKKIKRVFLEVRSNNIAAIGLYEKYGFTINRVRKNYYSTNEDAYEMKLNI